MKPPITSAQAMSHPAVFETVNSLGKMADELRTEVDALTKERDALSERVNLLKTTNEVLAEKLAAAETAHLYIRTQSLNDAASLCEGEKWCNSGDKSVKYIDAYNDGCAACGAVIRRLK